MAAPVRSGEALRRALRLRCPPCGAGRLFRGAFAMHERCRGCGFRFEREPGYFLGSIYVNYGVAVAVALALHFGVADAFGWSVGAELGLLIPVIVASALVLFRWSRALWLAFDLACDPPRPEEFAPPDRKAVPLAG